MPPTKVSDLPIEYYEIELPDGSVKKIDPWEFISKIETEVGRIESPTVENVVDVVRAAAGAPTAAEAQATTPPTRTLSASEAMRLKKAVEREIEMGMEKKSPLPPTQKSPPSTTSSPPNGPTSIP